MVEKRSEKKAKKRTTSIHGKNNTDWSINQSINQAEQDILFLKTMSKILQNWPRISTEMKK